MSNKLKIGIVGLGTRGYGLIRDVLISMCEKDIEIVSVCDLYEDRITATCDLIEKNVSYRPQGTLSYDEVIDSSKVEAVMIFSSWETHIDIALKAMRAGKAVAMEVGGAYTVEDCQKLVDTYEQTHTFCMLLENCCYGKRELMVLNMVRQGILGDIVHCSGGYCHDLRQEITEGKENRHYRLRNYINRNCENYPTHELGPIAKILDINNGNRLLTLSSTASCAKGLHQYIKDHREATDKLQDITFEQGDIVTTVIKCAHGQTIVLTLDTTLPRCYSRSFTVRGTKGAYFENNDSIFIDGEHNNFEFSGKSIWNNATSYEEKYLHPLWKNFNKTLGHGGMDPMVFSAFVAAVKGNHKPPIDVYDMATYMCISTLSEESIAKGGAPVAIPDFTRGKWMKRHDIEDWKYNLDKINWFKDLYI